MSIHLSKELRKQYGKRSLPVRKGDEAKETRGSRKGLKVKVAEVNLGSLTIYLEGQVRDKVSGRKVPIPFKPANLQLVEAKLADKKRAAIVERAKAARAKIGVKK